MIEVRAHIRNVKYSLTDETVLAAWRLQHAGKTLTEIKTELGLTCSVMTISRAIQRAKLRELTRQRRESIKARILRQLEKSPAHAQFTVEEREALANQLAGQAVDTAAATPWESDDPEIQSDRFKTAMNFGRE